MEKKEKNTTSIPAQFGRSIRCDFDELTWTFEMNSLFTFTGGKFAILPQNEFIEILNELAKLKAEKNQDYPKPPENVRFY